MTETFIDSEKETIFTNNSNDAPEIDEELVSDKVHILANSVYQEFEVLIKKHGQGTVDGLMPLIVSMLETMDKLYTRKDELCLELDLIKVDQSELYMHYDREKTCRRLAEEKNNRLEDQIEEERRELEDRVEFVESNNRLLEMRNRNCRDLISRLEEKETEIRKEYSNIQLRYSELLRSKADHGNKHRGLSAQSANECPSSGHHSPVPTSKAKADDAEVVHARSVQIVDIDETDSTVGEIETKQMNSINELSLKDEMEQESRPDCNFKFVNSVDRNQELAFFMNEETFDHFTSPVDNSNDDDDISSRGEYDDLIMGKEIEFLIKENQDLIETKIALNVVKDDLITKLDEMTGEMCMLREDLRAASALKKEYKAQAQEFEKRLCDVTEQLSAKERRLAELGEDDDLIECSMDDNGVQTKTKFTRSEVARILHDRNKYKEELLELQETLRYQSSMLDRGTEPTKKGTLWNIFSNVLSNATAFTSEAFIGSGNEMTVGQLNRNFSGHTNKAVCYVPDEHGALLQLPNLVHGASKGQRRVTPGSAVRVTNPLLTQLATDARASHFDLVPVDSA